ncbi:AbrB/MazE/SpoVT family DNA-binding domain-containing protein [Dethiobacter alkaliphilus]|uniref:Transcriptional regulator, AbrB family n=1 Tax=Dethiobacter alkaliphilus AHT 1 TaxID=555088 RepID=C0GFP3_DETAL|nr:AbrB/MazE/SpoVT family DNA-binding domain-containing protein [Dethiobacter alkaliphilus]EEG78003.1 transcriptional regulator, AbrB family [Dethiobacter alkaliphilus AHT 1]
MIKAKITGKGQITVPKEVREKLEVGYGDYITFDISGKEVTVKPLKKINLTNLYGTLPATRPYKNKEETRREVTETLTSYSRDNKEDE